jgi:hypothetical protein
MSQVLFTSIGAMLLATVLSMPAQAQQRPQIETTKVDRGLSCSGAWVPTYVSSWD